MSRRCFRARSVTCVALEGVWITGKAYGKTKRKTDEVTTHAIVFETLNGLLKYSTGSTNMCRDRYLIYMMGVYA